MRRVRVLVILSCCRARRGDDGRLRLAPETCFLAALCLLDLATTCFWIKYRDAAEGNPLMAWYLQTGGTPAFVAIKIVLFALPLFVAEWARRARPQFVRAALRLGIVAYLALYGTGVAHVNQAGAADAEYERMTVLAARPPILGNGTAAAHPRPRPESPRLRPAGRLRGDSVGGALGRAGRDD